MISITCLVLTHPKQSSNYVWHNFINHTGWDSKGLVFLLGLINPTLGFGGLDGAVHLAEDSVSAAKTVPRALCYSLVIGFATSFFFVVSMLYCVQDIDAAITSRTGLVMAPEISSGNQERLMEITVCLYTNSGFKLLDLEQRLPHSWHQ